MWNQYIQTNIAEMREVTEDEINGNISPIISISKADRDNGSPRKGDMVARNQLNPENDQWLVAEKYFNENFKEYEKYSDRF